VILSGGLHTPEQVLEAYARTGAAAVMLARGSLGNPWLFEQVLGRRADGPSADEVIAEWLWVMERAVEHLGTDRAGRYLRKFHPWYVERLGGDKVLGDALQQAATVDDARAVVGRLAPASVAF
jgi:tRNA-dihydrouridine synthase B